MSMPVIGSTGGRRVMVVGKDARAHALVWRIALSPLVAQVFAVPGNPGTALVPKAGNIANVQLDDLSAIASCAQKQDIHLMVVSPEGPLVAGLADRARKRGIAVFGPGEEGARLEGSKCWAKSFMSRHRIPTAPYRCFPQAKQLSPDAEAFIRQHPLPMVIKKDRLAAGKGVKITRTYAEAVSFASTAITEGDIVVEDFLPGDEVTYTCIVSNGVILPLAPSQDHSHLTNDLESPLTGGMGAYSPVPWLTVEIEERIMAEIVQPTVEALTQEKIEYAGALYFGLMLTECGPQVLEFNCRFGDPETEALLMRPTSDLVPVLLDAAHGKLSSETRLHWANRASIALVLASPGYPDKPDVGYAITIPSSLLQKQSSVLRVFHAGTKRQDGTLLTDGGRVLVVATLGKTFHAAQRRAYEAAEKIQFNGKQIHPAIGHRAVAWERSVSAELAR